MTNYKCNNCDLIFDETQMTEVSTGRSASEFWGSVAYDEEFDHYCPVCGSDDFEELHEVPELELLDTSSLDEAIAMLEEDIERFK